MNYSLGCAFNLKEMFETFNNKKLKMTCNQCEQWTGDKHRDKLAMKIFKDSAKVIFNDIIDNNVTFELPTNSRKSEIHMLRTTGDDFAKARLKGKWYDVDFLMSNFSGYLLSFNMYDREGKPTRVKPIYVDKLLKLKITDNTNKGMLYC